MGWQIFSLLFESKRTLLVAGIHTLVKIINDIKIGVPLKQFTFLKQMSQRGI